MLLLSSILVDFEGVKVHSVTDSLRVFFNESMLGWCVAGLQLCPRKHISFDGWGFGHLMDCLVGKETCVWDGGFQQDLDVQLLFFFILVLFFIHKRYVCPKK